MSRKQVSVHVTVDRGARGNVNRSVFRKQQRREFPRAGELGGESLGIAGFPGEQPVENHLPTKSCYRVALRYELQHCGFIHACVIADGVWLSFAVYCTPDEAKQTVPREIVVSPLATPVSSPPPPLSLFSSPSSRKSANALLPASILGAPSPVNSCVKLIIHRRALMRIHVARYARLPSPSLVSFSSPSPFFLFFFFFDKLATTGGEQQVRMSHSSS